MYVLLDLPRELRDQILSLDVATHSLSWESLRATKSSFTISATRVTDMAEAVSNTLVALPKHALFQRSQSIVSCKPTLVATDLLPGKDCYELDAIIHEEQIGSTSSQNNLFCGKARACGLPFD